MVSALPLFNLTPIRPVGGGRRTGGEDKMIEGNAHEAKVKLGRGEIFDSQKISNTVTTIEKQPPLPILPVPSRRKGEGHAARSFT